jgi:hypothetical protein
MDYVDELEEEGKYVNPLAYNVVIAKPEEWSNIPKLTARFSLKLEQQIHALTKYTFDRSGEETTKDLRTFTEEELKKAEDTFH